MADTAHIAATSVHQAETLLFFTLLQLTVIILAARMGGAVAKRLGQAAVVGEIVTGILLGPSLFGWLTPEMFDWVFRSAPPAPMQILSQIGLLLLMFQIGLEFDFAHLGERQHRRTVTWVAGASLILPFILGFGFGWFAAPPPTASADPLIGGLFVATAFSITALPILGRIMIEFHLTRTALGVIAISAAAINDVVGWLLLALVSTLAISQLDPLAFALKIMLVGLFFVVSWWGVRPIARRIVRMARPSRYRLPPNLLGVLLALIFVAGMTTYKLGIFAIFGGFLMGVILHDQHGLREAWAAKVGHFVAVFFLPVFFTYTGLRTDIGSLDSVGAWGLCVLAIFLATAGKFIGAYLAARRAGLGHHESSILGIMMNTRALMELVVINVGYDLGVISGETFTMLVIMAIFSTVITTPFLRLWLPRIGHELPTAIRE
ncbi:MAG: cation:proton antiporter [Azoarcus sp.]|jgi:Kef-type K+ transport system membrane component KefB|nr:cation:proton antiporter [Azoarcus sp.]